MRITDIREKTIPVSRYADTALPSGGLTTSLVRVETDAIRGGKPVIGYGYASVGRFGQGGLIRERFAPRLLQARPEMLLGEDGGLDPRRAWRVMMQGEKPGGHGERCVAVGAIDMAIWDAAAKAAQQPLWLYMQRLLGLPKTDEVVTVYAGGGYLYPDDDLTRLSDEMKRFVDLGFTHAKMKIGSSSPAIDLARIETAANALGGAQYLAVDAMNLFDRQKALDVARTLEPLGLWWFEDICDPLDFETQAAIAAAYAPPIAAGEALFSLAEAKLLHRYGGLRPDRDRLLFDPAHCYGLTGYLQIVEELTGSGWPRAAFWPHGGHLFGVHLVGALGLGGGEVAPFAFAPFSGLADDTVIRDGQVALPDAPGIGFESRREIRTAFEALS